MNPARRLTLKSFVLIALRGLVPASMAHKVGLALMPPPREIPWIRSDNPAPMVYGLQMKFPEAMVLDPGDAPAICRLNLEIGHQVRQAFDAFDNEPTRTRPDCGRGLTVVVWLDAELLVPQNPSRCDLVVAMVRDKVWEARQKALPGDPYSAA